MDDEQKTRYAVLTGASGDIGKAITAQLTDAGFTVISVDHCPPVTPASDNIHYTVDLCDTAATQACAAEIAKKFAPLTFVHCAGQIFEASLEDVRADDPDAAWRLSGGAAIWFVQAMLPAMDAAHYGRVVLIGSRAMLGLPGRTTYSATKSALFGLTRTWALELASRGITVNLVSPGPIATRMLRAKIPAGSKQEESINRQIPLLRLGLPADVARAVRFFTDQACDWVTGQNLYVCGGTSISNVHG